MSMLLLGVSLYLKSNFIGPMSHKFGQGWVGVVRKKASKSQTRRSAAICSQPLNCQALAPARSEVRVQAAIGGCHVFYSMDAQVSNAALVGTVAAH